MNDAIETEEQIRKFLCALEIFADKDPTLNYSFGKCVGTLCGQVIERFKQKECITLQEANDMLYKIQNGIVIGKEHKEFRIKGRFARLSTYIEDAFDIAIHDKPLPPRPEIISPRRLR